MNSIKTGIILAGGKGSRINEFFPKTPKALININGKTILERQITKLVEVGMDNIIVSTCHLADEIDSFLQSLTYPDVNLYSIRERSPLGTGGAIKNILLNTNTEEALVINGDTLSNFNLESMINFHTQNKLENTIGVILSDNNLSYGGIEIQDGKVLKFVEKTDTPFPYTNTGIYILRQEAFNHTHKDVFSLEKEILPALKRGELSAYEFDGKFWDIGTKERYDIALKEII